MTKTRPVTQHRARPDMEHLAASEKRLTVLTDGELSLIEAGMFEAGILRAMIAELVEREIHEWILQHYEEWAVVPRTRR